MTDASLWAHTDSRGFSSAIAGAVARAWTTNAAGAFTGWGADVVPGERAADLRALLIASIAAIDFASTLTPKVNTLDPAAMGLPLGFSLTLPNTDAIRLSPRDASQLSPPLAGACGEIVRAWNAIATRHAAETGTLPSPTVQFATVGGSPSMPIVSPAPPAAFVPWVAAVAIVSSAAVLAYLGTYASEVVDRQLARSEDTRRMVALTGKAADLVAAHAEADRNAGKGPTPLSAEEKQIVDLLTKSINAYAVPSVTPAGPVSKPPFSGSGDSPSPGGFGLGTVGLLAIAWLAWSYFKGNERGKAAA